METLALPFSVNKETGRLARTDRVSGLLSLMRAMAASPRSSWGHAPWFGLQEVFESASPEREDQHGVQDALNRALAGLGVTWATVESVRAPRGQRHGERRFELTLRVDGQGSVHGTLRV